MEVLVHVYRLKHKGLLIQVSILLTYLCLHVCVLKFILKFRIQSCPWPDYLMVNIKYVSGHNCMKAFRCLYVCSLIMFMQGPEEIRLGTGHLDNGYRNGPQVIRVQAHNRKIKKKINCMFILSVFLSL